jgi:uncharacterized protein (TIGR02147 family)
MSAPKRPEIFTRLDFRSYLQDMFAYRHALDPRFRKSSVCRLLGLKKTRSYFQDVLNGKFVSKPRVEDFVRVFELEKDEAAYFRLLVNFNQATDSPEEREICFGNLLAKAKSPKRLLSAVEYGYYREWFYPVVRAILNFHDVADDYAHLGRLVFPPITAKQARTAMTVLSKLKLIRKDGDGYWRPAEKSLTTGPGVKDILIKQFQLKRLVSAQKALMREGTQPHRVLTRTISLSGKAFQSLQAKIEAFSAEVGALIHADADPADRAYQLDVLFYPCAKMKR